MKSAHFSRRLGILLAGSMMVGMYAPGRVRAAEYGDVKTLDDFHQRWQEHHRSSWSGSAAGDPWTVRNAQHSANVNRAAAAATLPAAENPHSIQEGVLIGAVREAMMVHNNRTTGVVEKVPRLVLVGWAGDRAYLPEGARQELAPYIGKMAKVDCIALALTSYSGNTVCHDLVVEKILKLEPYVAPAETGEAAVDTKGAATTPLPPPAVPAAPAKGVP